MRSKSGIREGNKRGIPEGGNALRFVHERVS